MTHSTIKQLPSSTKQERLKLANNFIEVIAGCGRNFFRHDRFISSFELSEHGRVFFIDHYSKKRIYTHRRYCKWRGFTSGGTMKSIVESLRDFIMHGQQMNVSYFQAEMGNGFRNPWGYGECILIVKAAAVRFGVAV
jgi:hypothetical protein